MPTVSQTTDQTILEAAEKLFLEKGYAKTSTTEIARMAGCNQAMVHYYFRTKENLFKQVFKTKVKTFVAAILQVDDQNLPFEERIRRRISSHFELIRANRKFPMLLFNESATNPALMEQVMQGLHFLPFSVIVQVQAECDAEAEKGTIRKTDARHLIFNVFSLNVMAFMAAPLFKLMMNVSEEQYEKMLEEKKEENIQWVLNSLKP